MLTSCPSNGIDNVNRTDRKLLRDLVVVVALKLIVLSVLWFAFVRDQGVSVDAGRAAAALTSPASGLRASQGENHGQ